MSYQLIITKSAVKELAKIPKSIYEKISYRISELPSNPIPEGSIKLKGYSDCYRIRVGDYRIIYELYKDELIIKVIKIGHRSDVYRYGK